MKNRKSVRLPILSYHDIHEGEPGTPRSVYLYNLSLQFYYLKTNGFNTITIRQLIDYTECNVPLPERPVLLTFDNGYKSINTCLYPLLRQYNMRALVFLTPSLVPDNILWNQIYLSVPEIKTIPGNCIEWGIQSYKNSDYRKFTLRQIADDISLCFKWFHFHEIHFVKALSLPFATGLKYNCFNSGKLFLVLHLSGIKVSFGTGSKLNLLNRKNTVYLKRLEVTGKDNIQVFASYLQGGKRSPIERFISNFVTPFLRKIRRQYN